MHRTESDNLITVGGKNIFTNGPPGTTRDAVDVTTIQEELAYVIEQSGLTLKTVSTETNTQLKEAIDAIITAGSPNSPVVDFESKNLIINHQSSTTVDADADRLSFINSSNVPIYQNDINVTFDIATDLMAGTSEKSSTWYQMWLDSAGVTLLVPDITGTTDGTTASKLVDSGETFETDLVQIGDVVYNLTDLTQTTVVSVDSEGQLELANDIFTTGEDYKIRILTVTGLGSSASRIGAVYNNSGSDFDDSTYTQIQEPVIYDAEEGGFSASSVPAITLLKHGVCVVTQSLDWTGKGIWHVDITYSYDVAGGTRTGATLTVAGITNAARIGITGTAAGGSSTLQAALSTAGNGNFDAVHSSAATSGYLFHITAVVKEKPTFHL
jgi:hypothetical protein